MSEKVLGFKRKDAVAVPLVIKWIKDLKIGETNLFFIPEDKLVPVVSVKVLKEKMEEIESETECECDKLYDILKWAEKEAGKK